MTRPTNHDSPDEQNELHFLEQVMRFQDGTLSPTEIERLSEAMRADPEKRKRFRQIQIRTTTLNDLLRVVAFGRSSKLLDADLESAVSTAANRSSLRRGIPQKSLGAKRHRIVKWVLGFSVAILLAASPLWFWNRTIDEIAQPSPAPATSLTKRSVLLVGEDRATFFGKSALMAGDEVIPQREYMLQSGLVELKFPCGATAIIEAPAIFRVEKEDRLALSTGGCSVHAPPGAEGFEVITPMAKVIDRGTRFYVNVGDSSETQIHVIEGAADLYASRSNSVADGNNTTAASTQGHESKDVVHLRSGEAMRMGSIGDTYVKEQNSHSDSYRAQLPDRLVNYQAESTSAESVTDLLSVTVQRGGNQYLYPADELIPIDVTWYRPNLDPESNGYLCGPRETPSRLQELLEDRNLTSGLINFGGQSNPIQHRPVITNDPNDIKSGTPGLGIRFHRPVVNHAGPDVILFEIQPFPHKLDGDPFHVYPLTDRADLRSYTVKKFDLTMESPHARVAAPLWSHRYRSAITSLEQLKDKTADLVLDVTHMHFRVIGVGIDLSELGYTDGEEVEELFFQSASADGTTKVDPVFIGGLPPLKR